MSTFVARQLQQPTPLRCAALGPDRARQLVAYGGEDGTVRVYPFTSSSPVAQLCGLQSGAVNAIAFDVNERTVVAGGSDGGLCVWELATERIVRQACERRPRAAVTGIAVHKSDAHVATIALDGTLRLWDFRKRTAQTQLYREAQGDALRRLALSPCGRWAATGAASGTVRLYDLSANRLTEAWETSNNNSEVTALRFHPEMPLLAAGTEAGEVAMWNVRTLQSELRARPTNATLDAVCFCGTRLVYCAERAAHTYTLKPTTTSNSDSVQSVFVPWRHVADIVYSSYVEEMWYCTFDAATATTGVLPLRDCCSTADNSNNNNNIDDIINSNDHAGKVHLPRARSILSDVVEDTPPRQQQQQTQSPATPNSEPTSTTELCVPGEDATGPELQRVAALVQGSTAVTNVLQWRLKQLRTARTHWASDPSAAADYLTSLDGAREENVLLDFFAMLQRQCLTVPLSAVPRVLALICTALDESATALQLSALRTLRLMKDILLQHTTERQQSSHGSGEAATCYAMALDQLRRSCEPRLRQLARQSDRVGTEARAVRDELAAVALLTNTT